MNGMNGKEAMPMLDVERNSEFLVFERSNNVNAFSCQL